MSKQKTAADERTAAVPMHRNALLWTARRRLYERLSEEGNPYPNNTDISTFLSQSQNNGIAAYADIQRYLRQRMAIPSVQQNSLVAYDTLFEQQLDQLAELEAMLNNENTSPQDSAELSTQRDSLLQLMALEQALETSLLQDIWDARSAHADTLHTQNTGLTANTGYEANEKTVNEILLATLAINNNAFTELQNI